MRVSAKILFLTIALMVISLFFSCEHRPLEDPHNGHYVRVYIKEDIKNVTYGFYDESREKPTYVRPRVLRVALTDPKTDELVTERYLQTFGEDERGYYIDGYIAAAEGSYNLMIYNFGSGRTKIRNEYNFYDMQAYTSPIAESYYQYFPMMQEEIDKKAIRYCPDHLFVVTSEPIKIENNLTVDTLYTADGDYFEAESVVKSYYLQVRINGFEYVTSAVSLLSGMAGSTTLSTREMNESDVVSVFFDMDYAEVSRIKSGSSKTAILYTTFNTFGKLPNKESIYTMNFEFTRTDGTSQLEVIDITSMFDEPLVKNEQWILIEKEIEITPAEGSTGGLKPGVEGWDDIICDIPL